MKASPLRVILATIAFGMGINCPDVRQVIYWGMSKKVEGLVGVGSYRMPQSSSLRQISTSTTALCNTVRTQHRRRSLLFRDFNGCDFSNCKGCKCCDVCPICRSQLILHCGCPCTLMKRHHFNCSTRLGGSVELTV